MQKLTVLGVVLIVLGVAGLVAGQFSYTDTEQAAKVGPLQVTVQKERHIPIPTIVSVVVIVAGLGVVLAGRRAG